MEDFLEKTLHELKLEELVKVLLVEKRRLECLDSKNRMHKDIEVEQHDAVRKYKSLCVFYMGECQELRQGPLAMRLN